MVIKLIVLVATLVGHRAAVVAQATGCHPTYVPGKDYSEGDWVSVVYPRRNYECTMSVWCKNPGYSPGGIYSALAWEEHAECDESVAIAPASDAPELWAKTGCPARFSPGTNYGAGDTVSVCNGSYCMVYVCNNDVADSGEFCSMIGFEPGTSLYGEVAWTELGSCTGSLAPAVAISPASDTPELWSEVGCPAGFSPREEYGAGDTVSVCNSSYCTAYVCQKDFCSVERFEPGTSLGEAAWAELGLCSGSMAPTVAPTYDVLPAAG